MPRISSWRPAARSIARVPRGAGPSRLSEPVANAIPGRGRRVLEQSDGSRVLDEVVDRMGVAREREALEDDALQPEPGVVPEPLAPLRARPDVARLAPDEHGDGEARGIPVDLAAAVVDDREGLLDLVRRECVEVQLVGEPGGQAPGHLRAVAADEDRDA